MWIIGCANTVGVAIRIICAPPTAISLGSEELGFHQSGNKVPLAFGLPHAPTLHSLLHILQKLASRDRSLEIILRMQIVI
jgi:hypothetical protein